MTSGTIAWRPNLRVAALCGAVLLASVAWLAAPRLTSPILQFDAEQGNIAAALLRGDGFADPYGTPSGPTAWTPPVYPLYLAAVFSVFGVKSVASAWVLLVLDAALAAACVLFTLAALDLGGCPRQKPLFAGALVALTWIHQAAFGPWLMTGWFVCALVAAFLMAATGVCEQAAGRWWLVLAISGAVLVLTHAGCGAACIVVLCILWIVVARRAAVNGGQSAWGAVRRTAAGPMAALLVCLSALGAWTARNWVVFHQVIPLKSTGWFEICLAETYAPDGVLDDAAMIAHQPYSNPRLLTDYTIEGEAAFLAPYRAQAKAILAANPGRFIRHVGARALNVFSFSETAPHVLVCRAGLSREDGRRLVAADLAARYTNPLPVVWTSLELTPADFEQRLDRVGVAQPRLVLRDWLNAKAALLEGETRPSLVLSGIAMAGLPAGCLLAALLLRRGRPASPFALGATFYVVAVVPNVLITHYSIHQFHFLGLHALFIAACAGALLDAWATRRKTA